ncbi:phenylalanine ammonia-lyase [Gossypium hirsutum]|uniref:phenylalanine ammonia-lyase n=1 Tax=Gossypium hirsutum TaxID=3635 RepID=A0ABM3A8U6_GOSHI|nr:phenylalanine ammonia-lyase-like [Gossypium hirsutum]
MATAEFGLSENGCCVSSTHLHWKKAADALHCSHFNEVTQMVSQFAEANTVEIQGTTFTVAQVTAISHRNQVMVSLDESTARDRVANSANWVTNVGT